MTRPMPGPPEKYQLLGPMVIVWEGGNGYYYHPSLMDDKRLTDAECAAEYWRASYHLDIPLATRTFVLTPEWVRDLYRTTTLHRFATRPHALEEA